MRLLSRLFKRGGSAAAQAASTLTRAAPRPTRGPGPLERFIDQHPAFSWSAGGMAYAAYGAFLFHTAKASRDVGTGEHLLTIGLVAMGIGAVYWQVGYVERFFAGDECEGDPSELPDGAIVISEPDWRGQVRAIDISLTPAGGEVVFSFIGALVRGVWVTVCAACAFAAAWLSFDAQQAPHPMWETAALWFFGVVCALVSLGCLIEPFASVRRWFGKRRITDRKQLLAMQHLAQATAARPVRVGRSDTPGRGAHEPS